MAKPDIVDECTQMLQRLCALAPDLPPQARELIESFEPRVRQAAGGEWVYVRKGIGTEAKKLRLGSALREQRPLGEAFVKAGVSRATGYRLLGRK